MAQIEARKRAVGAALQRVVGRAVVSVGLCGLVALNAQSVSWISPPPEYQEYNSRFAVYAMTPDMRVIVATGSRPEPGFSTRVYRGLIWENGVWQELRPWNTWYNTHSEAYAVSENGRVVVGISRPDSLDNSLGTATRWLYGVPQNLGTLPGYEYSVAHGVSADGRVVVGWAHRQVQDGSPYRDEYCAFRWVNGVMQPIGSPDSQDSQAFAVSADGRVVVGWIANRRDGAGSAFRWENGVLQYLGTPPTDNRYYRWSSVTPRAVSPDGRVVIGLVRGYRVGISEPPVVCG